MIGFIPVSDFDAAEAFYSGVLGMPVESRDGFALVLRAAHGTMIRCVKAEGFTPQPFTILGWAVSELAAQVDALGAKGVEGATLRVDGAG